MATSLPILQQLLALEHESIARGIPILGHEKGAWLWQVILKHQPQEILELGTANGYSGIIMASQSAHLTTIDIDPRMAAEAKDNFAQFKIHAKVIIGDAVAEIQKLAKQQQQQHGTSASYDLIFIDFAKKKYVSVIEDCITLVRPGGLIIADNISFPGCADYKKAVLHHPQLQTQIIDIKDGLSCSVKVMRNPPRASHLALKGEA